MPDLFMSCEHFICKWVKISFFITKTLLNVSWLFAYVLYHQHFNRIWLNSAVRQGKSSCDLWASSPVLLKHPFLGSSHMLLLLTLPTANLWPWLAEWAPTLTSWLRQEKGFFFMVICLWHRRKTVRFCGQYFQHPPP